MSEVEQVEAGSDQAVLPGHSGNVGAVRGIPGKHIENVGLLDLRGVTAEELAQVESIENVGAVLIDASLRAAMTHIATTNIGTIAEVDPDYRVIVEPWIEFSKATLEAMPQGQKL